MDTHRLYHTLPKPEADCPSVRLQLWLCCSPANRTPNHDPGCDVEAEVMSLAEVIFHLEQDLIFDIAAGLPSAVFNSQVETAESQPPMIRFLILSGWSIHSFSPSTLTDSIRPPKIISNTLKPLDEATHCCTTRRSFAMPPTAFGMHATSRSSRRTPHSKVRAVTDGSDGCPGFLPERALQAWKQMRKWR
jgi:hypothetical protein